MDPLKQTFFMERAEVVLSMRLFGGEIFGVWVVSTKGDGFVITLVVFWVMVWILVFGRKSGWEQLL
jgi:hypothetical protein